MGDVWNAFVVLGLVLIAGISLEQGPSVGPRFSSDLFLPIPKMERGNSSLIYVCKQTVYHIILYQFTHIILDSVFYF